MSILIDSARGATRGATCTLPVRFRDMAETKRRALREDAIYFDHRGACRDAGAGARSAAPQIYGVKLPNLPVIGDQVAAAAAGRSRGWPGIWASTKAPWGTGATPISAAAEPFKGRREWCARCAASQRLW